MYVRVIGVCCCVRWLSVSLARAVGSVRVAWTERFSAYKRALLAATQVRVQFQWYDVFRNRRTASYSDFYEQACMLFNLAAALANVGSSQVLVGDG